MIQLATNDHLRLHILMKKANLDKSSVEPCDRLKSAVIKLSASMFSQSRNCPPGGEECKSFWVEIQDWLEINHWVLY